MGWSWRIGRIAGIDVYMHFTFLFLLLWVAIEYYSHQNSVADAMVGVTLIILVFGIVVLHELGHALAARRYGIQTRDITLLPIGGVARLERMPEDPKQELVVAIAGPAVNVVLAALFFLVLLAIGGIPSLEKIVEPGGPLVEFLSVMLLVNVMLVLFNLIPAFPMDGGRVLRALLAMRMDYVHATQTAATIGQMVAVGFVVIGLLKGIYMLLFIALFVWIGAASESGMVQIKSALSGIPVKKAMITDFRSLSPQDTLGQAVEHILAGFQQDFPVEEDHHVVGVLTRSDLISALHQQKTDTPVSEVMQREFQTANPNDMLEGTFIRLQNCQCRSMPVVHNDKLVGMITTENVGEFLMIQGALHGMKGQTASSASS